MSSTELDLPLLPSAEQIRRREFATIRRGYDPEQVRDYLRQVAAQVETLERQVREARLEAESAQSTGAHPEAEAQTAPEAAPAPQPDPTPQVDPYDELAERLADLIRSADGQAGKIMSEAQTEATRQLNEARAEADRIRTDAQSQAEAARQQGDEVHHAKVEAERVLSTLATRREHLVEQLQQMQARLLGVAQELESALGEDDDDGPVAPVPPVPRPDDPGVADPNYEALWVSSETAAMNIGDIPAIDIDFGEDDSDADPR
jgi:DivIVA domain-containing protein